MSTLRVTAERLTIHPHPNADALELAQVGLFRAVVAKGAHRHDVPGRSLLRRVLGYRTRRWCRRARSVGARTHRGSARRSGSAAILDHQALGAFPAAFSS